MIPKFGAIGLAIVAVSVVIATIRLLRGPTVPDRLAAAETIGTCGIASILLVAITSQTDAYLDTMVLLTALGSLGVIAMVWYFGGRVNNHDESK